MVAKKIVVCGGGGFIGGHLIADLRRQGIKDIRSVDIKPLSEWYQVFPDVENLQLDLQKLDACQTALKDASKVYNLAADMGGMGFIENNRALCMLSVLINTHLLMARKEAGVERYFYASSACVYNADKQRDPNVTALKEADAYPGHARGRLRLGKTFQRTHVPPFPRGFRHGHARGAFSQRLWAARHLGWRARKGARRRLPQGHCRPRLSGKHEIEIWGDGHQTRSFMYIDDCLKGIEAILASDIIEPINLGSSELVSINQLVDIVEGHCRRQTQAQLQLESAQGSQRPQ